MPGYHTKKQKRQAEHVADSERRRSKDPKAAERIGWATVNARKAVSESFQLVTIDDCYDALVKDQAGIARYHADAAQRKAPDPSRSAHVSRPPPTTSDVSSRSQNERRVAKFPRKPKPTVQMKPISDDEAATHLRSGTYNAAKQKSLRWLKTLKAIVAGYSEISGDEVLKANRGPAMPLLGPSGRAAGKSGGHYRKRGRSGKTHFGPDGRPGPKSAEAKFKELRRAMETMSAPVGSVKPPGVYLPGVHNPKSPVRAPLGFKKPSMKKIAAKPSSLPAVGKSAALAVSAESSSVVDGGGTAAELSNSLNSESRGASMTKAEHGFKRGDLVVHNASADSKDHGTIGAVGSRSTDTHIHLRSAGGAPKMVHHSEVRAASPADIKYHQSKVDKLHGLGFTKGFPVANINYDDLFKSELGADHLVDCPHCEAPITKGDLAKAHKGKGKSAGVSGKRGKSSAHVSDHNGAGGEMRGGDGRGVLTPSRGVPGASKTDAVVGVQNGKGSRTRKGGADSSVEEGEDDVDKSAADAGSESENAPPFKQEPPTVKKSISIRGTEWVQYVDDGEDRALAKSIAERALGGTSPTRPLDLNNDLTRLLV